MQTRPQNHQSAPEGSRREGVDHLEEENKQNVPVFCVWRASSSFDRVLKHKHGATSASSDGQLWTHGPGVIK